MGRICIGIMSGTSLDGADGALVDWPAGRVLGFHGIPFPDDLRQELNALCQPGPNEIERMGRAGVQLARLYASVAARLLEESGLGAGEVAAIGCHGQTIRHRPAAGFTLQIQNPALLAELSGIAVAADFRSRDLAAGGQGAPLAPAFHEAVFGQPGERRAVINIGGISNITVLEGRSCVTGFDCGPGNVLLDEWAGRHLGTRFDEGGAWAASGRADPGLLARLLAEPYFQLAPPKSTGRELFHAAWLQGHLEGISLPPEAVQATLLELTAQGIAQALAPFAPVNRVLVCGGGAFNTALMARLADLLEAPVAKTDEAGMPATQVEAIAFSWLAERLLQGEALALGHITGATHPVRLGALYPA